MQSFGVLSLLLCIGCMFVLFRGYYRVGEALFGASMLCMLISLGISLVEIRMSVQALDMHLVDLEKSGA